MTKLTTAPTPDIYPLWSPDGSRIVYAGISGDQFDLMQLPTTSAAKEPLLFHGPLAELPLDWSRDGRFLLYRSQQDPSTGVDLWAIPMEGAPMPLPVAKTAADETSGSFSPDARWVALESNETGRYEVYVQSFPVPGTKTIASTGGGMQPRWGPNGRELFYVAPDGRLMSVSLRLGADGRSIDPASPVPLFAAHVGSTFVQGSRQEYVVSLDGSRFLMNTLVEQTGPPITLLLHRAPRQD